MHTQNKSNDIKILRDLAKQYKDICVKEIQEQRRRKWASHNSLVKTEPLIYVREGTAWREIESLTLKCEDEFYKQHEYFLRKMIFQDSVDDDYILEPWIPLKAVYLQTGWGLECPTHYVSKGGSFKMSHPLKKLDAGLLTPPKHLIDEVKTNRNLEMLHSAIGDIINIHLDRGPAYRMWSADISTDLGFLRGIEQIMWDMMDNPKGLHELLAFMRDCILAVHAKAEADGDWSLAEQNNQAMPYAQELPRPTPNSRPAKRNQLWTFCAAQEFTLVSPEMHEEFLLNYQIPIIQKFGLVAYGCCEDLTRKIPMLRKIKNLRRIAVAPRANLRECVEQIGNDYVISWRPNPADMVCCDFDQDRIRKIISEGLRISVNCHIDITLKDIETVQGQPERLRQWVQIVRQVCDGYHQ